MYRPFITGSSFQIAFAPPSAGDSQTPMSGSIAFSFWIAMIASSDCPIVNSTVAHIVNMLVISESPVEWCT